MARKARENRANRPVRTRARTAARPAARRSRSTEDMPYHHGALRDALLQAAERVLERDGLAGLTLRAVAREAGVSHAAPTHHFGHRARVVAGARLHHAVARWTPEGHPAPAARRHRSRPIAGGDAALDRRPPDGAVISASPVPRHGHRCR